MMHGGLTLERYAAIGAALRYFPRGRKALVLERVGITAEAWDTARVAWSTALDSAEGGTLLAEWSAAFEEAGQKLREAAPNLDSFELTLLVAPSVEPAPSAPPAPEPPLAQAPAANERPRELPSYLAAPSAAATAAKAPPVTVKHAPITGEIPTAAAGLGRAVLPFGSPLGAPPAAQPIAAQPIAAQPVPKVHASLARTADLEAMPKKPRPRTMPFTIPAPPAAPPAVSPHAAPTVPAAAPPVPAAAQASTAQVGSLASPAGSTASLTFNQYAALKAELSAFPNDAELIWSKFGVAERAARDHVEQHWVATLAADPKKQQHFNAVFSQYLEQWARRR